MFNKHNTVHPAPKQVAWLNLVVGAGPQIREFTNPREQDCESVRTDYEFVSTVYKLRGRIAKPSPQIFFFLLQVTCWSPLAPHVCG